MKQTQTYAWSLAGEEAVAYALASSSHSGEWRGSGVLSGAKLRESDSSFLHLGRAGAERKHRNRC